MLVYDFKTSRKKVNELVRNLKLKKKNNIKMVYGRPGFTLQKDKVLIRFPSPETLIKLKLEGNEDTLRRITRLFHWFLVLPYCNLHSVPWRNLMFTVPGILPSENFLPAFPEIINEQENKTKQIQDTIRKLEKRIKIKQRRIKRLLTLVKKDERRLKRLKLVEGK